MQTREQIIIQKVTSKLPLTVFPEREILPRLREHFKDEEIGLRTEFRVHRLIDMREEGGLTGEIRPKGLKSEEMETVFLCSITHFRVKMGEPYFKEIEKYRVKRIRRIARKNRMR